MTTHLTYPRGTDAFIGATLSDGTTDQDPTHVAWTTGPPPAEDAAEWVTPAQGTVAGTPRAGATTGGLAPGTRYHLWALPPDPDEYRPVRCAVVWVE